jgi:hypothetical protein
VHIVAARFAVEELVAGSESAKCAHKVVIPIPERFRGEGAQNRTLEYTN